MAYFVILAGESSGDTIGSSIIHELKKRNPNHEFKGIAGPKMIEAGCEPWFDIKDLSVMGIANVLKHIPRLLKIRKHVMEKILNRPPDAFIGIDYPEFNLSIESKLKQRGIKTVHVVSPSFWAWRENRVKTFSSKIDLMLCLFPFEEKLLLENGVNSKFIGHPLADKIPLEIDKKAAKKSLEIQEDIVITLMPGSRRNELKYHASIMFEAAKKLSKELHNADQGTVKFVVPTQFPELQDLLIKEHKDELEKYMFLDDATKAIPASDLVITKSGTSTLESAIFKKPTIVVYKMPNLTFYFLKVLNIVKTQYAALPNILLGRKIFPELIQNEVTSENIMTKALEILNHQEVTDQTIDHLKELHLSLKKNSALKAAEAIEDIVA